MHLKSNTIQLNIALAITVFATTVVGYLYTTDFFVASSLWITSGFVVGFYTAYDKKSLPGLFGGVLAANLVARGLFIEEPITLTIFYSLFLSAAQIFEAFLFKKLMNITKSFGFIKPSNTVYYLLIAIFVSFFTAFMSSTVLLISMDFNIYIQTIIRWTIGDFSGILIFGTVILFMFYYKETSKPSDMNILYSVLFIGLFSFVSFALFSNTISWFQYKDFSYLFIVFFLVLAFAFSYRMILFCDVLFALLFQYFLVYNVPVEELGIVTLSVNLYLLVLSISASAIKMILFELEHKNTSLEDANARLGNLINSTNSLLRLSDDLLDSNENVHENYIIRIFRIATNIFDGFDYASCYVKNEPYIHFLDTVGYDLDTLNSFDFISDEFHIDTVIPVYVNSAKKTVKESLPNDYEKFTKTNPSISESIRFGIFIEEGLIGGMSFDVSEKSNKHFNQFHYESYKSFQKLMNSFFEINYLNYKNINLKNDIVLSLIRTLELYDHYTGGHSEEVAYLSKEIAKRLNLSEKEIYDIYWAGIVHDIGKVGISSEIINKPGKLTLKEYEMIKKHPVFGYDILNKSEDLSTISLLVRHHHEWWNGSGYPDGLSEDNIPLGAQIIALCDAVSTMATKRSYTVIRTSSEILKELQLYQGIQFAPGPAQAMISFIEEGLLDKFYQEKLE